MFFALSILPLFFVACFSSGPEENPSLFQGDMMLDAEQLARIQAGLHVNTPSSRGARIGRRWTWGVLPYTIHSSLAREPTAVAAIHAAIDEWSQKTCITFKERTHEDAYVTFIDGFGCSAHVGRQGSQQFIQLAPGCWTMGIVAHEIGHALGFFHEQSRADRDKFVKINWYNIQANQGKQFMKLTRSIDSLDEPYDLASIMHYGPTHFSKNGRPTILPRKKGVEIGQRRGLSAGDARQMNKMYNGCK